MTWVSFLRENFEAFEKFKYFKTMAEIENDCKIKRKRFDNGGEFTSKEFDYFFKKHDIKRQYTIAKTIGFNPVQKLPTYEF